MDRPVECSMCTKDCALIYKQLRSTSCIEEALCQECPMLKKRLEGKHHDGRMSHSSDVACKECHTLLRDIINHDVVGCAECYEVFYQAICQRLDIEHLDFKQDVMINKDSIPSSEQLLKLSKDLQDAVIAENFEKAALLRDEINKLKKMMSG